MYKFKKLFRVLLSVIMVMTLSVPANAATFSSNATSVGINYVVYNQNGEVVKKGTISSSPIHADYHWSGISLDNGWYTSFMPSSSSNRGFYVHDGTEMKFSYTLKSSATIDYQFTKNNFDGSDADYDWRSGSLTGKSYNLRATADETKYYYVGITNASSDTITITSVDFTF